MPCIYETINLHNREKGISPWRYVGSDQFDRCNYFGSSLDLENDITRFGKNNFEKNIIQYFDNINNKDLRKIEAQYLRGVDARTDPSYYNKNNNYAPGCGVKGMKHRQKKEVSEAWRQSRRGWCPSNETRNLWSSQRLGKTVSEETKKLWQKQRTGANNPNALEWTLISPTGHTFTVNGLRDYCKQNNLSYGQVYHSRGGWTAVKHGQGKGGRPSDGLR